MPPVELDVLLDGGRETLQRHRPAHPAAGIAGAIPGLFSGGPNHAFEDDTIRRALPAGTPPAKSFVDEPECYSCNENDIIYSAPLVFTTGYLHFLRTRRSSSGS